MWVAAITTDEAASRRVIDKLGAPHAWGCVGLNVLKGMIMYIWPYTGCTTAAWRRRRMGKLA
jgi:hypothetical protein